MINLSLYPTKSTCFIWMLFVIPSCVFSANELYKLCSGTFSCGNQRELYYPFWTSGREECGHPDFKLDCSGGFAEINISSVKFRILAMTSGYIRLARSNFIDNLCPSYLLDEPFDENVLLFPPDTEMLTIYYDCERDFSPPVSTIVGQLNCPDDKTDGKTNYYVRRNLSSTQLLSDGDLLNAFSRFCYRNVGIPVNGPALTRLQRHSSADNLQKALTDGFEVGLNHECLTCLDSSGACGYNLISNSFTCYSTDEPQNRSRNKGNITKQKGLSSGMKIGSGAGVTLFLFLIFTLFLQILRKRKTSHDLGQQNLKAVIPQPKLKARVSQPKLKSRVPHANLKALIPMKQYSYAEVKRITKSFAQEIGRGGFGTAYRGALSDGRKVAVKVLKDLKGNSGEDFINEVASMSQTSHINIATLLGFCSEGSNRAIIYEFLENASLHMFISSKTSMNMDWAALYRIALGVARGLEYLHHGCKTRIVHFDIKPHNVLLDDNFCPKVSDFGLAKLCKKKESILSLLDTRGTIGYIAPEVFSRMYGGVSHKSDVYSYGMLVLEMIGARDKERTNQNYASNPSSMYFPEWIYKDLEKGDNGTLIENAINIEEEDIAKKMTLVGLWCIQPCPQDRPAMNRVVEMMEGNLDALKVPPRPVYPAARLQESSTLSEDISVYSEIGYSNIA